MPAIIRFLGYDPLPPPKNWAEQLVRFRVALGMTQQKAARQIGVDQSTLARWERGDRQPAENLLKRVLKIMGSAEHTLLRDSAA